MRVDIAILGGGIAGLAAAYELRTTGLTVALLERAPRPGGLVLSEEADGFTIDAGPDALLAMKPAAIELCRELGLGDRLVSTKLPRIAYIQRGGRLHALPASSVLGIPTTVGPFLKTALFTWRGKLRMGAELFVPPRRDGADESIGAFMTRRFGREATDYLAEPLLAGIHAGDVNRLSLAALFPRLAEAERTYGSLIRAFRARRAEDRGGADAAGGAFRSLPGGLSEMIRALVAALPAGVVRLGTTAAALEKQPVEPHEAGDAPNSRFRVTTAAGESLEAGAVIAATPAGVTASLVETFDPALAALCREIRYLSVATIVHAFDRGAIDHPLAGAGFVVPRAEGTAILAGSWLSSKWPHRAPEGRALLRTFVGGARDPQALDSSDRELAARSCEALRPILGIRGEPLFTRVYRWVNASAQHEVGHLDRVRAIEARLSAHPGLFVTGSAFRGVGIPDGVADGRATARAAAALYEVR
jgi:oxygen-dependent protoporphyrinogen oxidase